MMDYTTIQYQSSKGVAKILLDRPAVLNSLNSQLLLELKEVLTLVARDNSIRCLVITGVGRAFCAGQDLTDKLPSHLSIEELVKERYNSIVETIRELPKPVIAAVNGVAAGAGASLALMCDIVVAHEEAVFVQAFSKIGLIPDCGGTFILPRLVGLGRSTAAMFLAEEIDARKAVEWGMIYKVVSDERFLDEVERLAIRLSQMPTKALAFTKQLLNRSFDSGIHEQLNHEAAMQQQAIATADFQEGVKAFMEKRMPIFKGE